MRPPWWKPWSDSFKAFGRETLQTGTRIKVGGLKIIEGGACVASSSPEGEKPFSQLVTAPLSSVKINLSFLTHVAGDRTSLCTASRGGDAALTLLKSQAGQEGAVQLQTGTVIVAVYPHNKRADIIGAFIRSLARSHSVLYGLASSPAAITGVIAARRTKRVVQQLFEDFYFPAFESPQEFFAAQTSSEEYYKQVVAEYQEKVIKVYWIVSQPDLDLWALSIPSAAILENMADALIFLKDLGLTIPFLIAIPRLGTEELMFAFSTGLTPGARDQGDEVRALLRQHLPGLRPMRLTPVAGIFLHGPHFGDRYGIANALAEALEHANITILALSCTVSSISVIIRQHQLAPAQLVLGETFESPVECAPATRTG